MILQFVKDAQLLLGWIVAVFAVGVGTPPLLAAAAVAIHLWVVTDD